MSNSEIEKRLSELEEIIGPYRFLEWRMFSGQSICDSIAMIMNYLEVEVRSGRMKRLTRETINKALLDNQGHPDTTYTLDSTNDTDTIDKIQEIRTANNKLWMDLLRLAMKVSPDKAKDIMRQISANDERITGLMRRLANND